MSSPDKRTLKPQSKMLQIEAGVLQLQKSIAQYAEKEEKLESIVDAIKLKAKECLEAGDKAGARLCLERASKHYKILKSCSIRKKVLEGKKYQLEQAAIDIDTIEAMGEAQKHLSLQSKYNAKLEDLISDNQEISMQQQEIESKFKYLQEELEQGSADEMMMALMGEISQEKAKAVAGRTVIPEVPEEQNEAFNDKGRAQ